MIKKLFVKNTEGRVLDEHISKAFREGNYVELDKLKRIRDDEDKRQTVEWYKGFGAAAVSGAAGVILGVGLVVLEEAIKYKLNK